MNKKEKELVIARLQTMPDNLNLCMGNRPYSREGLIKEVENETKDGEIVVQMHMEYIRALANGTLMDTQVDDIRIRKVKVLGDRAKEEADKQGLSENDLVIIRTRTVIGSLPTYELTKIEGSPTQFLQDKILNLDGTIGDVLV